MRLFYDIDLAVANIWSEARGETLNGKIAVGEVMRERTRRHYASDGTLVSTIFWPHAFSGFNTENTWRDDIFKLDNSDVVVRECFNAWKLSETSNLTKGAVLYCNLHILKSPPIWARPDKQLAVVDSHTFFGD